MRQGSTSAARSLLLLAACLLAPLARGSPAVSTQAQAERTLLSGER